MQCRHEAHIQYTPVPVLHTRYDTQTGRKFAKGETKNHSTRVHRATKIYDKSTLLLYMNGKSDKNGWQNAIHALTTLPNPECNARDSTPILRIPYSHLHEYSLNVCDMISNPPLPHNSRTQSTHQTCLLVRANVTYKNFFRLILFLFCFFSMRFVCTVFWW